MAQVCFKILVNQLIRTYMKIGVTHLWSNGWYQKPSSIVLSYAIILYWIKLVSFMLNLLQIVILTLCRVSVQIKTFKLTNWNRIFQIKLEQSGKVWTCLAVLSLYEEPQLCNKLFLSFMLLDVLHCWVWWCL